MKVEELQKKKEEAERFLKVLQEDSTKVANGIQQVAGRIQMLNELIEEETAVDKPDTVEEVADEEKPKRSF